MPRDMFFLVAIGLIAVAIVTGGSPFSPPPGPNPVPADVAALRAAFGSGNQDSLRFSCLCDAIAKQLERDLSLPVERRRLSTGAKVNAFRAEVRKEYLSDSLAAKYPALSPFLQQFFATRVGEYDEKLDDTKGQNWVRAFRELAAAARAV
jgi:hypothetical protein